MLQSKQKIISPEIILKAFMTKLTGNKSFRQIPKAISHSIIPKLQKSVDIRITLKDLTDIDKIRAILRPAARQLSQSIANEMQDGLILLSSILYDTTAGCTIDTVIDDIAIRLITYDSFDTEIGNKFIKACRFDIGYSWCKICT